jgi:hypothetical protein
MTTIQRLDALKVDLALQGLEVMHVQIEAIKASHFTEIKALQPKPKRVSAKKTKEKPLKVEITEAGKTTEVIFQTEKECEVFLKLKQKQRLNTSKIPEGFKYVPTDYGNRNYREQCSEYWQAAKDQNLDFNVVITRC